MARFVNIHLVDRYYGGPEEGGWWFTAGRLVRTIPVPLRHVAAVRARCERICAEHNAKRLGAAQLPAGFSEGRYDVTVSREPGRDWPDEQPYYS